jgi:hypothetical protein
MGEEEGMMTTDTEKRKRLLWLPRPLELTPDSGLIQLKSYQGEGGTSRVVSTLLERGKNPEYKHS